MKSKVILGLAIAATSTPAFAGVIVPTPEAGAGVASLALLGAAYAWMRRRQRS